MWLKSHIYLQMWNIEEISNNMATTLVQKVGPADSGQKLGITSGHSSESQQQLRIFETSVRGLRCLQNFWCETLATFGWFWRMMPDDIHDDLAIFKTGWRLWPPTRAISPGRGSRLSKPIDRTHIAQLWLWRPRNHENYTLGFLFF